jgi:hypothetical protein
MIRSILAVVVGCVVGGALMMLGHLLSMLAFPWPKDVDMFDQEAVARHLATLPDSAWVLALLSHAMGPLGGGFVAAWIANRAKVIHALIVGAFFLAGGVMDLFNIPQHPFWFGIADPLMYMPVAYLAGMLGARVRPPVSRATVPDQPYQPPTPS